MDAHEHSLSLELREGPALLDPRTRWRIGAGRAFVIGRGQDCDLLLPDASVSRRHATIAFEDTEWVLRDLGSRHGCLAGGRLLEPGGSSVIGPGQEIQIGAWLFAVRIEGGSYAGVTIAERSAGAGRVRRLAPEEVGPLVRRRLDVVLGMAEELATAVGDDEIADHAVRALRRGMGARAGQAQVAWVEIDAQGGIGRIVASRGGDAGFSLSTSLLLEAGAGALAVLESDGPAHAYGASIAQLGIRAACCAPVRDGTAVCAVLYLDMRDDGVNADGDAAAFVSAMAQICGLALSNVRRASLERVRAVMEADLRAARTAQRMMMPASSGRFGDVAYAMLSRAGRHVAGDLVGIEPRGDGRTAFYLGDVTGKGAGAAMVMAIAQSYLSATLAHGATLEEAATGLNAMLVPRIDRGQFISLWLGEYDPSTRTIRAIDAGHGYALLRGADGSVRVGLGGGALPIGIDGSLEVQAETVALDGSATLLLYSDGLIEQPGEDGERFGTDRAASVLRACAEPETLVARLEDELRRYAGQDHYDDDLTIAAFRFE